jgi:hypothetical protein
VIKAMAIPVTVDIPHKLGRAQARDRIDKGLAQIAGSVPGGVLTSQHWVGDLLDFTIEAMGQRVATRLEVFDDRVHAVIDLPPLLALFAAKIQSKLKGTGTRLLR